MKKIRGLFKIIQGEGCAHGVTWCKIGGKKRLFFLFLNIFWRDALKKNFLHNAGCKTCEQRVPYMSGDDRKVAHLKHFSSEGIVCYVIGEMFNNSFVAEFIHNGNGSVGDGDGIDIAFKGLSGTFLLQIKSSDSGAEKFYLAQKKLRTRYKKGSGGNNSFPIHIIIIKQGTTNEDVSRGLFCLTGFKEKRGDCRKCREECIVFRYHLYQKRKGKKHSSKKGIIRTFLPGGRKIGPMH